MAIQVPNIGLANGQTGDNEQVLWNKVIHNFTDTNNAASRIIGTEVNQIADMQANGVGGLGYGRAAKIIKRADVATYEFVTGFFACENCTNTPHTNSPWWLLRVILHDYPSRNYLSVIAVNMLNPKEVYYGGKINGALQSWSKAYNTGNTTLDANGFLKVSSPVIQLYNDKAEFNADAEQQNISFKRNGVGSYTLRGTTGLRTDGWYIEIPKDVNGNPLVAVDIKETELGAITIKTYKRIFDMTTFTFKPDLDNAIDIPDGRYISVRLNDNPEVTNEPVIE